MTGATRLRYPIRVVLLGFLLLCACWSTTWYAIRICLHGYPPLLGASLRFLLAAALLAGFLLLWRRAGLLPRRRSEHLALLVAGLANGIGYACLYLAEQTISGGTAAVIAATSPFFTAVVARLYGLEQLVVRRLVGVTVGFAGVAVMMAEGADTGPGHFAAMLEVAFAAAVMWPFYGAVLKRHTGGLHPLTSCTYLLGYTGLALSLLSLGRGERLPSLSAVPVAANLGLLYLVAVGSVLAWSVFLWLLKRIDLTVLATMGLIQPVLALLLDWLGRDAQLQPRGYLGAVLVFAGLALAALKMPRSDEHLAQQEGVAGELLDL